jgi:hypothetical protein
MTPIYADLRRWKAGDEFKDNKEEFLQILSYSIGVIGG